MDGWTDGRTNVRVSERANDETLQICVCMCVYVNICIRKIYRATILYDDVPPISLTTLMTVTTMNIGVGSR